MHVQVLDRRSRALLAHYSRAAFRWLFLARVHDNAAALDARARLIIIILIIIIIKRHLTVHVAGVDVDGAHGC